MSAQLGVEMHSAHALGEVTFVISSSDCGLCFRASKTIWGATLETGCWLIPTRAPGLKSVSGQAPGSAPELGLANRI